MAKIAMIDDRDGKVVNTGIAGKLPDAEGFTLLHETSWADPAGEVFTGQVWANKPELPAVFEWPQESSETEPQTLAEATAARDKAMADLAAANAAVDKLLSQ